MGTPLNQLAAYPATDTLEVEEFSAARLGDLVAAKAHEQSSHADPNAITAAGVTFENLNDNNDIGSGADQVPAGNHAHIITTSPTITSGAVTIDCQGERDSIHKVDVSEDVTAITISNVPTGVARIQVVFTASGAARTIVDTAWPGSGADVTWTRAYRIDYPLNIPQVIDLFTSDGGTSYDGWQSLVIATFAADFLGVSVDEASAQAQLGLGDLATKNTVGTADIIDSAVTPVKLLLGGTPQVGRVLRVSATSPLTLIMDDETAGAGTFDQVQDGTGADYTATAFQVGSNGAMKNEARYFDTTVVGTHVIEFTHANLDTDSYGSFVKDTATAGTIIRFLGDNTGGSEVTLVLNNGTPVSSGTNSVELLGACTWHYNHESRTVYLFGVFDLPLGRNRTDKVTIAGTTHTLLAADSGKTHAFTSATAVNVTLSDTNPEGWYCDWDQVGAGQLTFAVTGSATLVNKDSHTKSEKQHAVGGLRVRTNASGTNPVYVLWGATAS
jgi:hypothetical protein